MASANVVMGIDTMEEVPMNVLRKRDAVTTWQYKATELLPSDKSPLHNLQQKPAVLGSLQVMSGLLSVGVGIIFAVTQDMRQSLFCLFRVAQMTGVLFIIAGLVSNMLPKHPELLSVSLAINSGCLCVAFVAAPLIIADLAILDPNKEFLKVEIFQLCVLALESLLSLVLCFWFAREKRKFSL